MADQVKINGNQFSWSSAYFKLDGERYYGITSVAWDEKRERVLAYGQARHHGPRGRSAGKYTPGVLKITMWKSSAQALRAALALKASDGVSYGNVQFDGVFQFVDSGEEPVTVEAIGVTWQANTISHEESADPLKEDLELQPLYYRKNGLTLFDSTEGSP